MLSWLPDRIGLHPRRSLLLVLAFVGLAGVIGGPVAGILTDNGGFTPTDSGSARAVERIEAATGTQASPGVVMLVRTPSGAGTQAARARVSALAGELSRAPGVASVATAQSTGERSFVARDGRSTFIAATLAGDADEDALAASLLDRYDGAADVELGGSLISDTQVGDRVGADLGRAELLAFPLLLLLSLVFFRGRATWLPLVVGVTTVLGTFLALRAVNEAYGLSVFALNLVIGLGLGLAIDYTLFLVTRYREELEHHGPGPAAVRATMQTAGRTVVFSAATVAIALATLTVFPLGFLQSMGIAGAVVAVVAALVSLVVCPAFFALWGARLAVRRRRAERPAADGAWYRLSHAVMRRPAAVAVATTVVMLAVALPSLRAHFTPVDASVIPLADSSRTVADTLQRDYPGQETSPITLAVAAGRGDGERVRAYAAGLKSLAGVSSVAPARALDAATWQIDLAVTGDPEGPAAQSVVERLRASAAVPVLVGGAAAEFVDQQAALGSRLPLALGLLALLTFGVLWLMTGSVVLPLKALAMNALTVAGALGVLTLVYQDGRLEGLLDYTGNGGVEPTDFLVAAALVFALSTDYGVFLLGRIKEARDGGEMSDREAVALGLQRTGRVVTAAAVLLAVAIGAFSTSSISFIQQVGVATAAGVMLDAFIVRALLVPALMGLLGKWNWWSPMGLRRLHDRFGLRDAAPAVPLRGAA